MNRKIMICAVAALLAGIVSGIGIMLNDGAYSSIQTALGQGHTNNSVATGLDPSDSLDTDLETILAMLQTEKEQMMDEQSEFQINDIAAKNDQIAKLNAVMAPLYSILGYFTMGTTENTPTPEAAKASIDDAVSKAADAGITDIVFDTKGQVQAAMAKVRGMIDTENGLLQMNMLLLQSMMDKQNEVMEAIEEIMKKIQDENKAIVSQMN